MSNSNTAVAYQALTNALVPSAPTSATIQEPAPQLRVSDAGDEPSGFDWFADLTWGQILRIATLVMALITGLMCASALALQL